MFDLFGGGMDRAYQHRERMAEIELDRKRIASQARQPRRPVGQPPPLLSWPYPDPNAEAWAKGRRAAELEHAEKVSDPQDAALREHIARTLHDAATGSIVPDDDDPTPYGRMAAELLRAFDVRPR